MSDRETIARIIMRPQEPGNFEKLVLAGVAMQFGLSYEQMCAETPAAYSQAVEWERVMRPYLQAQREKHQKRMQQVLVAPLLYEVTCDAHGIPRGMRP